jgi:hypothetical protein
MIHVSALSFLFNAEKAKKPKTEQNPRLRLGDFFSSIIPRNCPKILNKSIIYSSCGRGFHTQSKRMEKMLKRNSSPLSPPPF